MLEGFRERRTVTRVALGQTALSITTLRNSSDRSSQREPFSFLIFQNLNWKKNEVIEKSLQVVRIYQKKEKESGVGLEKSENLLNNEFDVNN